MTILDRYIISEFFQVLCLGTLAILGVFFGALEFQHSLNLLSMFDIPTMTLIWVTLLMIPTGAMYALPAGLLFSTIFVLIRLNKDYELTALRTLGISLQRIMASFLVIGVLAATMSFAVTEYFAPQARRLSTKLLLVAVNKSKHPYPKQNKIEVLGKKGTTEQVIIIGDNSKTPINGFLVLDLTATGTITVLWSRLAEWHKGNWKLTDGRLFEVLGEKSVGPKGSFGTMTIPSMSDTWKILDGTQVLSNLEKTTAELKQEIDSYAARNEKCPGNILLAYHRRFSQPVSCFLLIMAAAPVALLQRRRSTIISYIYGGIMLPSYFILQQIFLSLGTHDMLDPIAAAWLPACILAAVGLLTASFVRR